MNAKSIYFALISVLIFSCGDSSVTDSPDEFTYSHERGPGTSAGDFLQEDEFGELILEIDYMEGHEPTPDALDNLQTFLEERLHKTTITIRQPDEIPAAAGQENYSANEVRDLEAEYRDEFTREGTLAAYFIILDGEYSQRNVLGIAYYNTSMAFFGETIRNISGGLGQPSRTMIETSVMRHEIGHILGLVENGTDMQEEHKDEDNGSHCNNESCLMYYAVQTTNFFANLTEGGEIPELDGFCIADLQAAGGK